MYHIIYHRSNKRKKNGGGGKKEKKGGGGKENSVKGQRKKHSTCSACNDKVTAENFP